jgi:secreted trypsin-like serine protease
MAAPATGIVIRHDRDDKAYLAAAGDFPSLVLIHGQGGHGTLIASSWVLTAAHVVHRLVPGHRVTVAGREIAVRQVRLHPGWRTPQTNRVDDLALLELAEPVARIEPTEIYRRRDEAGRAVTFAGRGGFGNGRDGLARFRESSPLLRKATNRVERVDDRWLVFRFDPPESATDLEGISGPGDSGGPAFLEVDGKRYLAGVSSWQDDRIQGLAGVYGVLEHYARVSSYAEWIDSVIGGLTAEDADRGDERVRVGDGAS